ARGDFSIGLSSLTQSEILSEIDHTQQLGVILLQPSEVQLGQLCRLDLARLDELRQVCDRTERQVFVSPWHRDFERSLPQRRALSRNRLSRKNRIENER